MQRLFSFFFLKNGPRFLYRGGGRFFALRKALPGRPTPRRFWRDTRRKDARFRLSPQKEDSRSVGAEGRTGDSAGKNEHGNSNLSLQKPRGRLLL